jgi:rhodanese-related sulfurtransferase
MHNGALSRKSSCLAVVVLLAIGLLTTSCIGGSSAVGVVGEAADTYLSSDKLPNISAEELFLRITDDDPDNDPFILSVRSPEDYAKGHIPGAINIPWREVAKEENLAKLPKDRQIAVYCYTGQISSQITAILNMLGYDAVNLKFGMTSWTLNRSIAPGRYEESNDCKDYPVVLGPEPEGEEVTPCPTCSY